MAGILYIVATPIGNLDDMPPRVAATFGAADFVAAEDTRVTMRLLNYLGLKKPMVSYYEHALQKGEGILRRIEAGELANEIGSLELPCRDNCICCDAAGCAHNKDGSCMAERVNISRADMTPKGKCLCRSFERDFKG